MKEKTKHKEEEEHEAKPRKNSLKTFVIFCAVVFIVILLSLIYRGYQLWEHSKFDGVSGFTFMVVQDDGKKAAVYAFDPSERRISEAVFTADSTLPNLTKAFSIPIEGEMRMHTVTDAETFPLDFTRYSLYNQTEPKHISLIDLLRMSYLYRTYPQSKKQIEIIQLPNDSQTYDAKLADFFIDSRLEKDKQSIRIVNGTAIIGLGGKMERMLTKTGANVISITTSHDPIQQTKIIYYGEKTYTVERLARLLPYPLERREGSSISDILIEIGEDSQRTSLF